MRTILLTYIIYAMIATTTAIAAENLRHFGGVGIDGTPWADGRIVVKQLIDGGPAHLAGIKAGDIITHIDGKQTKGSNFNEMVDRRLRGKAGTKIQINILRPGETKPRVFILTRRELVLAPNP
jgi:C-terminal processing protease CtpA/Prc